jgi:hypothetical protein
MLKIIVLLCIINLIRFVGLELAPPGFYIDEAGGAAQVMCIKQTGFDFYLNKSPLFSPEFPDVGIYTPAYLYGEYIWTTIFGASISSFRSFLGFITVLTILFLFLWVKKIAGLRVAGYVVISATLMPWAFQFSRVAWDPPVAVLFLVVGLWVSGWEKRSWLAGIFFAFSAYSYGPLRLTAVIFLLFLPGFSLKNKILAGIAFVLSSIPLLWEMQNASFMARTNHLLLWSSAAENPFKEFNFLDLCFVFVRQFFSHLSPSFLFISGDANLRHSIQVFGMIGWNELFIGILGVWFFLISLFKKEKESFFDLSYKKAFIVGIFGMIAGIIPSALTNEGNPHSLRAIAAWPFFAILFGVLAAQIDKKFRSEWFLPIVFFVGLINFGLYLNAYFFHYPTLAVGWFNSMNSLLINAYEKMRANGLTCAQVIFAKFPELNNPISFAAHQGGGVFLKKSWHRQEDWGVWSKGHASSLVIPVPPGHPKHLNLEIRAPFSGLHTSQVIDISLNGNLVTHMVLTKPTGNSIDLEIPRNYPASKYIIVDIRVNRPITPKEIGLGEDVRSIGIGLARAIFSP